MTFDSTVSTFADVRWRTGEVLVEGDQGLNYRVKARVNHLTMFFLSFSDMHKLSTSHD